MCYGLGVSRTRDASSATGAERYLRERRRDPEYDAAYRQALGRIARIDDLVGSIERRRKELGLSKADVARRAGLKPEAVRRLLTAASPNPTLATLLSIAEALDAHLALLTEDGESHPSTVRRRLNSSRSRRALA